MKTVERLRAIDGIDFIHFLIKHCNYNYDDPVTLIINGKNCQAASVEKYVYDKYRLKYTYNEYDSENGQLFFNIEFEENTDRAMTLRDLLNSFRFGNIFQFVISCGETFLPYIEGETINSQEDIRLVPISDELVQLFYNKYEVIKYAEYFDFICNVRNSLVISDESEPEKYKQLIHDIGIEFEPDKYTDEIMDSIDEMLEELNERECQFLIELYGLHGKKLNLLEVALENNTSIQRVRQVKSKALRKLRKPSIYKKIRSLI